MCRAPCVGARLPPAARSRSRACKCEREAPSNVVFITGVNSMLSRLISILVPQEIYASRRGSIRLDEDRAKNQADENNCDTGGVKTNSPSLVPPFFLLGEWLLGLAWYLIVQLVGKEYGHFFGIYLKRPGNMVPDGNINILCGVLLIWR